MESNESLKKENTALRKDMANNYVNKKEIMKYVFSELIKLKILKPAQDPFNSTKNLLENLNKFDKAIKNYESEIKKLKRAKNKIDSPKFKMSKLELTNSDPITNLDIIDTRIINLYQSIEKVSCYKNQILDIIDNLDEESNEIIRKFYIEKIDVVILADEFNCDQSTIYRKINKIINEIKVELFPGKFIDSLIWKCKKRAKKAPLQCKNYNL